MRVLLQRVSEANVVINDKKKDAIGVGLLLLIGIEDEDDGTDIDWLVNKMANLRIFPDDEGVMNRSLLDVKGEALLISQFTLHASTKKGNRPSYIKAAKPDVAIPLYNQFVEKTESVLGKKVGTGEFGADMKVSLVNDGPVTIWLDSKNKS